MFFSSQRAILPTHKEVAMYQALISQIDPTVNAKAVEAWMRLQYSTLGHLDQATFKREIRLFKLAKMTDDQADRLAKSFGL
jgi:hypothetical protein